MDKSEEHHTKITKAISCPSERLEIVRGSCHTPASSFILMLVLLVLVQDRQLASSQCVLYLAWSQFRNRSMLDSLVVKQKGN
mmetsp:Transcript_33336/g.69437  ORF Transcript_33336/g.69437 Transcript_33336/m.69437 type:complete len:82 (+) Transcript_33336:274-519(+)